MPATGSHLERIESPTRDREADMDAEGGSCTVCGEIQRLPEECVSRAISLTSPRDACRSEAVSASFRSAAASDDVWKSFLPPDYADILARAVDRVEFASMKQLYFRLCDPILIDGGKMGFFVDRETGVKCFILSARQLGIAWGAGDTPQYWSWIYHPESRFPEVAELRNVCWLDIHGRVDSRILSKRSHYSAYLIFKTSNSASGLTNPLQEASVTLGTHISQSPVRLMEHEASSRLHRPIMRRPRFLRHLLRRANLPDELPEDLPELPNEQPALLQEDLPEQADETLRVQAPRPSQGDRETVGKPQIRRDGWMEMLLGEFYNEEGDDGEVVMSLKEIKGGHWKNGLTVEGIEIRPTKK